MPELKFIKHGDKIMFDIDSDEFSSAVFINEAKWVSAYYHGENKNEEYDTPDAELTLLDVNNNTIFASHYRRGIFSSSIYTIENNKSKSVARFILPISSHEFEVLFKSAQKIFRENPNYYKLEDKDFKRLPKGQFGPRQPNLYVNMEGYSTNGNFIGPRKEGSSAKYI